MKQTLLAALAVLGVAACHKPDGESDDFLDCDFQAPVELNLILKDATTGRNLLDTPTVYRRDSIRARTVYQYGSGAPADPGFSPARFDTTGGSGIRLLHRPPTQCPSSKDAIGRWLEVRVRLAPAAAADTFTVERLPSKDFEYRYNGRVVTPVRSPANGRLVLEVPK